MARPTVQCGPSTSWWRSRHFHSDVAAVDTAAQPPGPQTHQQLNRASHNPCLCASRVLSFLPDMVQILSSSRGSLHFLGYRHHFPVNLYHLFKPQSSSLIWILHALLEAAGERPFPTPTSETPKDSGSLQTTLFLYKVIAGPHSQPS